MRDAMTDPVALSKQELAEVGHWLKVTSSPTLAVEDGRRLLATIESDRERIKTLEAAVKAWEAQNTWLAKRLGRALLRLDAAHAIINRPEVMEVLGLQEVAEADPDVADTAWAIIDHHREHRTAG